MSLTLHALHRLVRMVVILLLVALGSTVLVRYAPGYLSDAREMDARYAGTVRTELAAEAERSQALGPMLASQIRGWMHGDFGVSRQYGVPVLELIEPRLATTGILLLQAIGLAWLLAGSTALLSSARKRPSLLWQVPATLLLAIPTAAMATLCLLANSGGPLLVLTLLLAARDFKLLDRILRKTWRDPHLLHARAQGLGPLAMLRAHVIPSIASDLRTLATLSIVTGLSALVPVEVIFSVPGLGQLAWNAALNRDLPILLAITMIMAVCVTFAGMLSEGEAEWKAV
jgi:peptide/nickel transport system permease protein